MNRLADNTPPVDVCLLLRAHAEARWLGHEVVPVIRELEQDPGSAAARAYLEVLALEARQHAAETDAARLELDLLLPSGGHALHSKARRYHAAVRRLRTRIERRIELLLSSDGAPAPIS